MRSRIKRFLSEIGKTNKDHAGFVEGQNQKKEKNSSLVNIYIQKTGKTDKNG